MENLLNGIFHIAYGRLIAPTESIRYPVGVYLCVSFLIYAYQNPIVLVRAATCLGMDFPHVSCLLFDRISKLSFFLRL